MVEKPTARVRVALTAQPQLRGGLIDEARGSSLHIISGEGMARRVDESRDPRHLERLERVGDGRL